VKRYYADDSAATSVKVGYRQASYSEKTQQRCWVFFRPEKNDACARDGQGRHEPRCFFRLMVCAPLIEDGRDSRLRGNDEIEAASLPPAELIPNSSPPRSPRFQAKLEVKF
jgi:hypothetical protein